MVASFWGSFWIRVVFLLVIHSSMSVSCKHLFILISSLSWIEVNFFEPESMYVIKAWSFPVWYFFECCSQLINVYNHLRTFFDTLQLFFRLVYPFSFFVMIPLFPYFALKLFCFPGIWLLDCLHTSFPNLLREFSLVVLEGPVLSVLFGPVMVSF